MAGGGTRLFHPYVLYLIAVVLFFIDGFLAVFKSNVALVPNTSQPCPNGWARRHDDWPGGKEYMAYVKSSGSLPLQRICFARTV